MREKTRRPWPLVVTLATLSLATPVFGEEAPASEPQPAAEQPAAEQPAAEQPLAEQPAAEQPAAEQPAAAPVGQPASQASAVPEWLQRLGRVESVLIANEDPESALEFAQELLGQREGQGRLRLLVGACLMRLGRTDEALESFGQAVRMSGDDVVMQMQALYNVARAQHRAGRHREAAEAYERYVAFARAHANQPNFIDDAQRLAQALRARAEVTASAPRR